MENHPIPQDITGFQFKLVGKLTVKQFIYVGTGVFLAWLIYFVLKLPLFLSLPLALFFSLGGAALAFIPIDGRPMDTMIANFLKAVFAPTQYVYDKQGGTAFSPGQTSVNAQVSQAIPAPPQAPIIQPAPRATSPEPVAPTPEPIIQSNASTDATEEKIKAEEQKVESEEKELEGEVKEAQAEHKETSQLEEKLNEVIRQKEELEKELEQMKAKLESQTQAAIPPPPPPQIQVEQAPAFVPPAMQTAAPTPISEPVNFAPPPSPVQNQPEPQAAPPPPEPGPSALPDEPNVIKGTVKDSRGNPIQNVLVEVKDEEDNPVRAFKTNARGEFASATSLPNGNYTVVLEDPKMIHKFDTGFVRAVGGPLAPLGIVSIDPREELRRELFN